MPGGQIHSPARVICPAEGVHEAVTDQRGADGLLPGLDRGALPSGAGQKYARRSWLLGQPRGQQPSPHHHAHGSVAPDMALCHLVRGGEEAFREAMLLAADLEVVPTSLPWQWVTVSEKVMNSLHRHLLSFLHTGLCRGHCPIQLGMASHPCLLVDNYRPLLGSEHFLGTKPRIVPGNSHVLVDTVIGIMWCQSVLLGICQQCK